SLKRTFLVLDGHVGFRNFDQDAVEMFEQLKVPYGVRWPTYFLLEEHHKNT
ncbi:unnamed protein product, partial [Ixodes pacificus]